MKLQPVILCGGSGTRLWPLSREQYPKQLLALTGERTMLQATALRLNGDDMAGAELLAPLVVGNEEYRFITAEQLRQVGVKPQALVLEPVGRNTAPALTLAALCARAQGDDPVLAVMPADHVIGDTAAFREAACTGARCAARGQVVTFGIAPSGPHTGYGYLRAGETLEGEIRRLEAFIEKPDRATAERYVAGGGYFWNSGIFMLRASVWMREIERLRPDIASACQAAFAGAQADRDFLRVDREAFARCPSDSIDYAVMERLVDGRTGGEPLAVVIPLAAQWSDVGAWDALWDIAAKDASGNVVQGDVMAVDTADSLVIAAGRLVACVGLRDAVVVETPDAVLVAHRGRLQQIREVVTRLKAQGRMESASHRKVHRPWGWYDSIDSGTRFQVKRIVVNPGAAISLQMHHHRAEHWVVVTGTARVTRGEETFLLSENQSTYIPIGVTHRLENPGRTALEIIEVQSGGYLGEDDIVRFEDQYGRSRI